MTPESREGERREFIHEIRVERDSLRESLRELVEAVLSHTTVDQGKAGYATPTDLRDLASTLASKHGLEKRDD